MVTEIIEGHSDIVASDISTIKKQKSPIPVAKLREHSHLRPQVSNITLWSSIFVMLELYKQKRL